jgi:hypothetical protein
MNTAHTNGEWHAHDGQIYQTETGRTLALIPYFDSTFEEDKANQNLIAAAPDLLKSLVEVLEELNQARRAQNKITLSEAERNAQAAINKAINP